MKKIINFSIVFIAAFIIFFVACGGDKHEVKVGQEIYLKKDLPCAPTKEYMEELKHLIFWGKKDEATRMFYLGNADRIEKGTKIKILEVDGEYCKVYHPQGYAYDHIYWMYIDYFFE